jgi:hypothetical protein
LGYPKELKDLQLGDKTKPIQRDGELKFIIQALGNILKRDD